MKLLFAAGDVGGARAILPVARLAAARGFKVFALANGVLREEGQPEWQWFEYEEASAVLAGADVLIFATSVKDQQAVDIAKLAKSQGVPTLHVLDNWSNYASRIAHITPESYAVMDTLAADEARHDGVPSEILAITGHPNLASLQVEMSRYAMSAQQPSILFVSEPAAQDGGVKKRGYDEDIVAGAFVAALAKADGGQLPLRVLPHPREDRSVVQERFASLYEAHDCLPGFELVAPSEVRAALHHSTHVAGMSSILLYEGWLLGRATLSLQPGLIGSDLRTLSRREGLLFHDEAGGIDNIVAKWLARAPGRVMPDLKQHQLAAKTVLQLAKSLINP